MSFDSKHDMWSYYVLYLVKWMSWNVPCRENMILAYMVNFINEKVECVPWFEILFGFGLGKLKVLEWPMSQKWDFLLYGYKFDKY